MTDSPDARGLGGVPDRDELDPRARRVLRSFDHVLAVDEPLPPSLVAAAQDLYVWRSVDAELLELLIDSAVGELTTVRDERLQRFMAFGSEERGVHFECTLGDDGFVLEGLVVPAGDYVVRADRPNSDLVVETDDHGSFRLSRLDAGSTRLTIRARSGDMLMTTPWFMLQA
jgi:hypothetical protein